MTEVVEKFAPIVKSNADGSLSNPDQERVALRVAVGFTFSEAWEAIGKKTSGHSSRVYRRKIQNHPTFKGRVAVIQAEKTELEQLNKIWGETLFLCNQMYREALAVSDMAKMQKAIEFRIETQKHMASYTPTVPAAPASPAPASEEAAPNPVGKPVTQSPQAKRSAADVTKELLRRGGGGIPVPIPEPAVETAQ